MSEHVVTRESQTETIDQPRRRFFGTAAMTIAAAQAMRNAQLSTVALGWQ
jgi:hypothetical protein